MTETTLEKAATPNEPGLRGTAPVHNLLESLDLKLRWSLLGECGAGHRADKSARWVICGR